MIKINNIRKIDNASDFMYIDYLIQDRYLYFDSEYLNAFDPEMDPHEVFLIGHLKNMFDYLESFDD